jgi:hypothetical protein
MFEIFHILRRNQRDIVINVKTSLCKVHVIFLDSSKTFNFLNRFSKKSQGSNFNKIRPLGAELFHAER